MYLFKSPMVHPEKKGKTWTAPVIAAARYAAITGVSRPHRRGQNRDGIPRRETMSNAPMRPIAE
ncbi:hypothetical protein Taro_026940 [Colocasia esculenta]|uniref:Uncharacterized protein n=1 Tax=Colocasia esculenta TaxID=4460 RepID=A0A843VGM1_COLES|nr:hypothetical protein [Colocasia esculenta]